MPERIVAWNGRSITNPDYVEPPHVDTDDDFTNGVVDSESDDDCNDSSDFGDNGYVDSTSASEEEKNDGQFHRQGSDLVSPPVTDDGRCGAFSITPRLRADCPQPKPKEARRQQAQALVESAIAIQDLLKANLVRTEGFKSSDDLRPTSTTIGGYRSPSQSDKEEVEEMGSKRRRTRVRVRTKLRMR